MFTLSQFLYWHTFGKFHSLPADLYQIQTKTQWPISYFSATLKDSMWKCQRKAEMYTSQTPARNTKSNTCHIKCITNAFNTAYWLAWLFMPILRIKIAYYSGITAVALAQLRTCADLSLLNHVAQTFKLPQNKILVILVHFKLYWYQLTFFFFLQWTGKKTQNANVKTKITTWLTQNCRMSTTAI